MPYKAFRDLTKEELQDELGRMVEDRITAAWPRLPADVANGGWHRCRRLRGSSGSSRIPVGTPGWRIMGR
jgi:hypothetical protein